MREGKTLSFLLVAAFCCLSSFVYAEEISALDGTWVYDVRHLESVGIHAWQYSWGTGKSIANTTLEFDIAINKMLYPSLGLLIIINSRKISEDVIAITIRDIVNENLPLNERPEDYYVEVHFEGHNRIWIDWPQQMKHDTTIGSSSPWYRLSGPPQTSE